MTASGATGGSANSSNASTAVSQPNTTTPSIASQLASISNTSIAGGTAAAQVPPPAVPGFSTVTSASNLNSIVPTGK